MRTRRFQLIALPIATALAMTSVACGVGPAPRDASNGGDVPIRNSAAVVANTHAALDIDDTPFALGVLGQPDRDPRDRALDARYQGADLLTFLGVRPGMRVLELAAGGGYMTEPLARSGGPGGEVFASDPPSLVSRAARGGGGAMKSALPRAARPHRERAGDGPRGGAGVERPRARRRGGSRVSVAAVPDRGRARGEPRGDEPRDLRPLVPGGTLVVLDYRPRVRGPVPVDLHALHREESTNVRLRLEASGFRFVTEGTFLHDDPKPDEWGAIVAERPTALEEQDRFLLKFVKP